MLYLIQPHPIRWIQRHSILLRPKVIHRICDKSFPLSHQPYLLQARYQQHAIKHIMIGIQQPAPVTDLPQSNTFLVLMVLDMRKYENHILVYSRQKHLNLWTTWTLHSLPLRPKTPSPASHPKHDQYAWSVLAATYPATLPPNLRFAFPDASRTHTPVQQIIPMVPAVPLPSYSCPHSTVSPHHHMNALRVAHNTEQYPTFSPG